MGNAIDLPAPSITTLTLDRAWILPLVTSNLPVTRTRRSRGVTIYAGTHRVDRSFDPKPPTLRPSLPLERAADVIYASSFAIRRELASWISCQTQVLVELVFTVEAALVAGIIRMTANCRLPRENITR
jgi:hypothetical protein